MKKIVKPTGEIRLKGMAEKDGVIFEASPFLGPKGFFGMGISATAHEGGEIQTKTSIPGVESHCTHEKIKRRDTITRRILLAMAILFAVCTVISMFIPNGLWMYKITVSLMYLVLAGAMLCRGITIFMSKILGDNEIKSFSKFLAAKNAAENAFYDLGRVPNMEEVKGYSTYCYDNTANRSFEYLATLWVAISIFFLFPLGWYIAAMILATILIIILHIKGKLFFWQFLVVSKPEEIHYKVAIKALEESLKFTEDTVMYLLPPIAIPDIFSEEKCQKCRMYDNCKKIIEGKEDKYE